MQKQEIAHKIVLLEVYHDHLTHKMANYGQ